MKQIGRHWFPDNTQDRQAAHALRHRASLFKALDLVATFRTTVQAGGNVGLWPLALADRFAKVFTFEPEPVSMECLIKNCAGLDNVTISSAALGAAPGTGKIDRKSLGSHKMAAGESAGTPCDVITVDSMGIDDLDFLQLDVEGFELFALEGALETVRRCSPVIQLEFREFGLRYGATDAAVYALLKREGYRMEMATGGCDQVFLRGG